MKYDEVRSLAGWPLPLKRFNNWAAAGIILGLSFFLGFIAIAEELMENELSLFDKTIINAVSIINSPLATQVMKGITMLGSAAVMITITVIMWLLCLRYKKSLGDAFAVTIVLTGAWLMNSVLKSLFQRTRPPGLHMVPAAGYSFPSGHAMISLAFYGILGYLLWHNLISRKAKYISTILLALMVLAIGISRVYLGVHYPSDVLAGFAAGGVMLIGSIWGIRTVEYSRT